MQRFGDGDGYRPPRRPSFYDEDDDEPSEAELAAIRAEYMDFPSNDATLEAFEEQRRHRAAAEELAAEYERAEVTEETIDALTEEDWEQLKEMNDQITEMEKAGLIPSEEQVKQFQELTADDQLPPPDPEQADFRWDTNEIRDYHRALEMDYDQEYNMMIGTTPRRATEEERDPANVLEAFKPMLMEQLGIRSEVEWAQHAEAVLQGFDRVLPLLEGRNSQREELTLDEMVNNALPRDHPMYTHVANSLAEVKRNPFWPAAQKQKFIGSMLKDISR